VSSQDGEWDTGIRTQDGEAALGPEIPVK
jgi:hypothetical protein